MTHTQPLNAGCMEDAVLFLLAHQDHTLTDDIPDLWSDPTPHAWKGALASWVKKYTGRKLRNYSARPPRTVTVAVGWSPRGGGRRHAVVLDEEGRLLYDPHPSNAGVDRPDSFFWW